MMSASKSQHFKTESTWEISFRFLFWVESTPYSGCFSSVNYGLILGGNLKISILRYLNIH